MNINPYILWIATPVIGGIIGWFTNYLAVRMLFHPRKEIRILFFRVQGLIPKRQEEIADSIARTVAQELLTMEDVTASLMNEDVQKKFADLMRTKVAVFFAEKIKEFPPMIAAMIPDTMIEGIRESIVSEILNALPGMLESLNSHVQEKQHFQSIVKEKIKAFELGKLESLILGIAGKELRHIEFLGGVLGAAIGLINAALIFFL